MNISKKEIRKFQKHILDWYGKNKRDLPWRPPSLKLRRDKDIDPYHILVSEVMSQQTQLSRVIPKYHEWLSAFPTLFDLANASTRDVLFHWSGLGYNRRALYLQRVAQELVTRGKRKALSVKNEKSKLLFPSPLTLHPISWPKTEKELITLPGIGKYTARALLCFAFGKQVAVVDTNVRKVILHRFKIRHPGKSRGGGAHPGSPPAGEAGLRDSGVIPSKAGLPRMTDREIQKIADLLLPKGRACEWNQALMDYAAATLKKEKIPIIKQSKFKGSDRYYRGQIVKLSLSQKKLLLKDIEKEFGKSIDKKRLEAIILQLRKEGLIQ